jgi:hypothetical protein
MLRLESTRTEPSSIPPLVILHATSFRGSWGLQLKLPSNIVLEISDFTIPSPVNGNPLSVHLGSILGFGWILVKFIPKDTTGGTAFAHVNCKSIEFSVPKVISSKEVVSWRSRSVLHFALDTDENAERNNILRPYVFLPVRAHTVFILTSLEDSAVSI